MKTNKFIRACLLGGPGLDGYAYKADVYCMICTQTIVEKISKEIAPKLTDTDDPLFSDSEVVPQPIFFGESDCAQHCAECEQYLYGEQNDE